MELQSIDFNKIIKKKLYRKIVNELLNIIYDYKIQNINKIIDRPLILENKIIMTQAISMPENNIKIIIVELGFLKTINDIIHNNFYTYCSECGLIHAQHKYKNCGHYVNFSCAYANVNNINKCSICNENIINHDINLKKSNKKEICSICLKECNTFLTECGHYFHKSCIKQYCNISDQKLKCPMCRRDMFSMKDYCSKYPNLSFSLPNNKSGKVDIILQYV